MGITPDDVRPADIDETPLKGRGAACLLPSGDEEKAEAVPREAGEIVLTADTTVAVGRRIFGKPEDRDEAFRFLRFLSGRRHRVITAVSVVGARHWQRDIMTMVRMARLSDAQIEGYLDTAIGRARRGPMPFRGRRGLSFPGFPDPTRRCHGPAGARNLGAAGIGGLSCDGGVMKGSQVLFDTLAGREAAARLVDGQLDDLLIDPPEDRIRPGAIYRAKAGRPMKGQGGVMLETPDGRCFCGRPRGLPRARRFLRRFRPMPNRGRRRRPR